MGEPALKLVSTTGPVRSDPTGTFQAEVPAAKKLKMPTAVRKDASMRKLWNEIVPPLEEAGMLTQADTPGLEMALRHYRAAVQASDSLEATGPEVLGNRGETVRNPVDMIFRGESEMFLKYAQQWGMTWASRMRTRVPEEAKDGESNPFE